MARSFKKYKRKAQKTLKTIRNLIGGILTALVLISIFWPAMDTGVDLPFGTPEDWLNGVLDQTDLAPASGIALPESGPFVCALDVGQGDAVLIGDSGHYALIDTGTSSSADEMIAALGRLGVEKLELLVLTHPHADHIGGASRLLDEVPDMPQPQREKYTHIALEKSQRLEGLINEFFDITRYNLQQLTLEKEPVDMSYLLVQLTDEFYPLLQAHGNTIELNVPQDLTVEGDAGKLARVFNNLLKNAVSYSTPGTPIRLWAEQADEQARFFVQNQGKTIPAHQLDALFEKFFRLDEARSTATGGAGLGLAIAKEIHGGSISAHSEQGVTTFTMELPTKKSL